MGDVQIQVLNPSSIMRLESKKSRSPVTRLKQNRRRFSGPQSVLDSIFAVKQNQFQLVSRFSTQIHSNPLWIPQGNLWELNDADLKVCSDRTLFLGPNIDWFDQRNAMTLSSFPKFSIIVPSYWVIPVLQDLLGSHHNFRVWAAGVDIEFWRPSGKPKKNLVLYLKDDSKVEDASKLKEMLSDMNYKVHQIKYGDYTPSQFHRTLSDSFAGIWFGKTESQGIALLESWSMNVPTLILKCEIWNSPSGKSFLSSAAPYLNSACGEFSNSSEFSTTEVLNFLTRAQKNDFAPRSYVLSNFSSTMTTKNLLEILLNGGAH